MQAAVAAGVDVLNNSYGWLDPAPTTDYNGINEQIQNAFNAGVLMTVSSGNSNVNPPDFSIACNQTYPSNRPDVLTVAGIATHTMEVATSRPIRGCFKALGPRPVVIFMSTTVVPTSCDVTIRWVLSVRGRRTSSIIGRRQQLWVHERTRRQLGRVIV